MIRWLILTLILFNGGLLCAQSSYTIRVTDGGKKEPVTGCIVRIAGTGIGAATDMDGLAVLRDIPAGKQVVQYQYMGFKERNDTLMFPLGHTDTAVIALEDDNVEMEEVTVSTTRSSRTIQDVPTRIELISGEELDEKANMKPGDIKMLLSESTGIQTLQTSATSGNAGIRFEGMDGRYTQILKDGFPLYAGFSGGLGLMQTPPLDLKRVEIIKGASSTLYGGGAIAGLINLISKTPAKAGELKFLVNGTTAGGLDISGYYGKLFNKTGVTLYAAYNGNRAYAPDNTVFTAIPFYQRYTVNPKFFWYPDSKTDVILGVNAMYENRLGGDIHYILGQHDSMHTYYEDNKTRRANIQLEIRRKLGDSATLTLKNSVDHFNRIISSADYTFNGTQLASFTELNYTISKNQLEWVAGANIFSDGFSEVRWLTTPLRDYRLTTYGLFLQNTWDISRWLVLETGIRGDHVTKYGFAPLPRLSLLYRYNSNFSSRIGGGLGYKAPTIFTEESEKISYRNVLPVNADTNKLEHSYGANWDVNYKTLLAGGKVTLSVNQLLFYTHLDNPLLLVAAGNGLYRFENIVPHIDAKGAETNVKLGYGHFKLFLGYTYTHSHIHNGDVYRETPLTPRHHTNSVLMYELEHKLKIGLEGYYYSEQRLSDGSTGRGYWLCGFMAEKTWGHASVYINFENMLDSRQSRFESIYTGSITQPVFKDIYAPLDGFVANAGLKLNL